MKKKTFEIIRNIGWTVLGLLVGPWIFFGFCKYISFVLNYLSNNALGMTK